MYNVIEFEDHSVGIIRQEWFTPRKRRCMWPPYKVTSKFNKCLISQAVPDENWPVHAVRRSLYETDDLSKARQKCKRAESDSELASTDLEVETGKKTRKKNTRALVHAQADSEESDESYSYIKCPTPPINKTASQVLQTDVEPRYLLQDFNVDSPISPRSEENYNSAPLSTPTTLQAKITQKLILEKINSSLDLIANHLGHMKTEIEDLKQTQSDILLRISSPVSTTLTSTVPIDLPLDIFIYVRQEMFTYS